MMYLLFQMSSAESDTGALSATINLLAAVIGENNIKNPITGKGVVKSSITGKIGIRPKNG